MPDYEYIQARNKSPRGNRGRYLGRGVGRAVGVQRTYLQRADRHIGAQRGCAQGVWGFRKRGRGFTQRGRGVRNTLERSFCYETSAGPSRVFAAGVVRDSITTRGRHGSFRDLTAIRRFRGHRGRSLGGAYYGARFEAKQPRGVVQSGATQGKVSMSDGGVPGEKTLACLHPSEDIGGQVKPTYDCDQSGMIRGYLHIKYHSKVLFLPNYVCRYTVMSIIVVDCSICGKNNIIMKMSK